MTVKEILGECLIKMGLRDFTAESTLGDNEKELITSLLAALNIAYREIVCEYLPLTVSENVNFDGGELKVSALKRKILYPISVKRGDEIEHFKTYPDRIAVGFDGKAILEYAYMPEKTLTADDSIEDMRITKSALSDGTLGEYYFANKVFDLAKNFDTSFRGKMGMLRYKGRRLRLGQRGWNS